MRLSLLVVVAAACFLAGAMASSVNKQPETLPPEPLEPPTREKREIVTGIIALTQFTAMMIRLGQASYEEINRMYKEYKMKAESDARRAKEYMELFEGPCILPNFQPMRSEWSTGTVRCWNSYSAACKGQTYPEGLKSCGCFPLDKKCEAYKSIYDDAPDPYGRR